MKVVGIYNAKGTLLGELSYAIKKLAGRADCALCDITHGWNPWGKPEWNTAYRHCKLDLEMLHIEDSTPEQHRAAGDLPAILKATPQGWACVMNSTEIAEWKGNPTGLLQSIEERLQSSQSLNT